MENIMHCEGRVAMVTGGASGIGEASVRLLAAAGAKVAVCDVQAEAAAALAAELGSEKAMAISLDVTDPEAITAAVAEIEQQLGPIDILANIAGGNVPRPFEETDEEYMKGVIERRYGRIINMSSGAGRGGSLGQGAYSAAKGGVNAVTKTIALEMAPCGITCNAILPGPTETPPMTAWRANNPEAEKIVQEKLKSIPMGRFGTPLDMASAVQFFAADINGFCTGQLLGISGGNSVSG